MEREYKTERQFATKVMPWIVAGAALVLYLVTLNHWVNFNNLGPVARTAGLVWQPELSTPVFWLVTYPFRWLPAQTIPLALNIFAAVCASLTLALLARSVALLPHDRTEEQRIRERSETGLLSASWAWIPPLVAVLVCGLQITFWEKATAISVDILDLLLFAYIIRALLEFRLDGRESWLYKAAVVYGASMAGNFAMVAFFPAFLVALVWIRGLGFFNIGFLSRMFLLGSVGLLAYLLLPMAASLSGDTQVNFWQALKFNLAGQKNILVQFVFNKTVLFDGYDPLDPLWVLALPSLLPVLLIGVRWPAYFGDPSRLGVTLTTLILHLFHALILGLCLWVSLDPEMSPRRVLPAYSMLPLYYLGALSVGYYLGYFLVIFGSKPSARGRPAFVVWPVISRTIVFLVLLLSALVPAALAYRNLPEVRVSNGDLVKNYAKHITSHLPEGGGVVFSDDPRKLMLAQLLLQRQNQAGKFLFIETGSVSWPDYHFFLRKVNPAKATWAMPTNRNDQVPDWRALNIAIQLSETNQLAYLHPSFGYYFEYFYPETRGMTYLLRPYDTNMVVPPSPTKALIAQNETFWNQVQGTTLNAIQAALRPGPLQGVEKVFKSLHLPAPENPQVATLAPWYSLAANYWGVELQRAGELVAAKSHFELAVALNPDNVVAKVNLLANQSLSSGRGGSVQLTKDIEEEFGKKYRGWDDAIGANGPFDEANRVREHAQLFMQGGNYRQALIQYRRAVELSPDDLDFQLELGHAYLIARYPKGALEISSAIRRDAAKLHVASSNMPSLVGLEASAHILAGDLETGQKVLKSALQKDPTSEELLNMANAVYGRFNLFTNLVEIIDRQLQIEPRNPYLLTQKGTTLIQMEDYDAAIAPLNAALSITNLPQALLNRAFARSRMHNWQEAQKDYETLLKDYPSSPYVHYGLGEVAWNTTNLQVAARHYSLYLSNAPAGAENSSEMTNALARLKELKKGYR